MALFTEHALDVTIFKEPRDACAFIWSLIKPSLSPHVQWLAANIGYLRRSKEEADKDRIARQIEIDKWEEQVFKDPDDLVDPRAEHTNLVPEQLSRIDFQHGFLDTVDMWTRQGSGIGSLGKASFDFTSYMLTVPPSTVLDSTHVGGNHAPGNVRNWERRMAEYKKGLGTLQEEDDLDDAVDALSIPEHPLEAITPTLSHLILSDEDVKTLRLRFLLDLSVKNLMVLVDSRYTLNEKQFLTVAVLLKRVMDTPAGEGVGYQTSVSDQFISYVSGVGGTGKAVLIKVFLFGLAILDRFDEVLLRAPTGSAASDI